MRRISRGMFAGGLFDLFLQPPQQSIQHRLAVLFIDRFGQRDVHGTGLDAVLRVSAIGNSILTHDSLQTLVTIHRAAGMHIEEANLRDRLWADVMVFVVLRTGFEAATASHAT